MLAGTRVVNVVFRVSFPGKELGKGRKYLKGTVRNLMLFALYNLLPICLKKKSFADDHLCIFTCGVLNWLLVLVVYLLQSGLLRLKDYPLPFWLALFVEGTRFTQAKLLAAQEYANSTGLPVPRNTLIPRTKVAFSPSSLFGRNCLPFSCSSIFSCFRMGLTGVAFIFIYYLVNIFNGPKVKVSSIGSGRKVNFCLEWPVMQQLSLEASKCK